MDSFGWFERPELTSADLTPGTKGSAGNGSDGNAADRGAPDRTAPDRTAPGGFTWDSVEPGPIGPNRSGSFGPNRPGSFGPGQSGSYGQGQSGSYGQGQSGSYGQGQSGSYGQGQSGSYGQGQSGSYGPGQSGSYGPGQSGSYGQGQSGPFGPNRSAAEAADPADGDASSAATDSAGDKPGTAADKPAAGRRRRSFWRELPVLIVVALALALVIKTYALQAFYIPSGSMENTLDIGDRVLINKLVYDFRNIHRGDVVVFNGAGSWDLTEQPPSTNPVTRFFRDIGQMAGFVHGEDDFVKRVIGLPGDHVACCDAQGRVTVNGVPLSESSYLYPGNQPSTLRFSITVPPGRLWVMGDHRDISYDSRGHMGDPGGGTIPENEVQGRVFVRIWPPSRWGFMPIPATFQQSQLNSSATAALDSGGIPVQAAAPGLPLLLGFAGAVPVTVLQRRLRIRLRRRRN